MFNDNITKKLSEAASKIMVGEGVEENLSEDITPAQLKSVEDTADLMLKRYKVDVEFTKHFIDRVNDDRNSPEINADELVALFAKIAKNKGKQVKKAEDVEAVIKDLTSNLNLPIVVNRLGKMDFEMVAKTIMRKKNFQVDTKRNKVIKYESTDASEIETLEEGKIGKTVEEIKQMFQKFKGKELPAKMVKVLQDIVAKFDDNVDMLKKLVKANIPYVSLTAIGRLTWKHKISPSVARAMLPESFEINEMAYPHMMYDPDTGDAVEVNDEDEHEEYAEMGWVHEKPEVKKEESKLDKFTHIFCEETEELEEAEAVLQESVELEEGVYDPAIFKAVFLAGGPGSGKSFTVGKTALPALGMKIVNSDDKFEAALKKANLEMTPENIFSPIGQELRKGAKGLTAKQMKLFIDGRLGLVIDGTGKDYAKIKKQADKLKELGYEVAMIFVNTDLDTALNRNRKRSRSLPDEQVKKMWSDVQNNIGKFQSYFKQEFTIIDNSEGIDIERGTLNGYKKMKKFVDAEPKSPIAKKWIKKQLGEGLEESVELEESNVTPQKISDEDLNKIFDNLKSKQKVDIWFDSGIRKGTEYVQFEVGRKSHSKKYNVDTITFKRVGSESRLKYFLYRYNNRGGRIAFATGDMAAPLIDIRMSKNESFEESVELEEANVKGMSDEDLKDIQKLIKSGDADLPKDVLKAVKNEIENRNIKEESEEDEGDEEELEEKKSKKSKKKEIKVRVNPEGMMGSASRPHKSKKGKGSFSRREKHQGKKDQ